MTTVSWKRPNTFDNPKHVVECLAGLPGKHADRVLNVRADGSHINSKGKPITLPDTGNNRNKRLEKLAKVTGTARGSYGPGLGGYHVPFEVWAPAHTYAIAQHDRVSKEIRTESLARYRDGEPARIVQADVKLNAYQRKLARRYGQKV